jgi:hypothetical protein
MIFRHVFPNSQMAPVGAVSPCSLLRLRERFRSMVIGGCRSCPIGEETCCEFHGISAYKGDLAAVAAPRGRNVLETCLPDHFLPDPAWSLDVAQGARAVRMMATLRVVVSRR